MMIIDVGLGGWILSGIYVGVGNLVYENFKLEVEMAEIAKTAETATLKDELNKKVKLEDE